MSIYELNLGFDHPETADVYTKIGLAYKEVAQYSTASPWIRRAYVIFYKTFGPDESVTLATHE